MGAQNCKIWVHPFFKEDHAIYSDYNHIHALSIFIRIRGDLSLHICHGNFIEVRKKLQ